MSGACVADELGRPIDFRRSEDTTNEGVQDRQAREQFYPRQYGLTRIGSQA
jgi:hypothetical protein